MQERPIQVENISCAVPTFEESRKRTEHRRFLPLIIHCRTGSTPVGGEGDYTNQGRSHDKIVTTAMCNAD